MPTFFNGVDSAEVAGLNQSNSTLNIIVKQYFGNPATIDTVKGILASDKQAFDKEVELIGTVMEGCEALQDFSMHDVRAAVSRRINAMSLAIAKKRGEDKYLRFTRGKIQETPLAIEHNPA